ncbi:MAG: T9SS type A sorting domain-containing protein, partial [Chitinophagaceae bacterium]
EHLVSLYPNPVQRNEIHLKFGVMPKFAPSILILDNLGRVVVQKSIRIGSDVSFPIDNLASGQYYLRVSWDGREKVLGFVK